MTRVIKRTPEQQEYRDDLAKELKAYRRLGDLRQCGNTGREIAEMFLEGKKETKEYIEALGEGRKISKEIADKLMKKGMSRVVADNIEKFEGIDRKEIANELIKEGHGWIIVNNLEKFEGVVDHIELANKVIDDENMGGTVVDNIEKFKGIDLKEIAKKLMEAHKCWAIIGKLEKFEGVVDYKELVEKSIEEGHGYIIVKNLEKFEGVVDHIKLAYKVIEDERMGEVVVKCLNKFKLTDRKKIAKKLIEEGFGYEIEHYPWRFGLKLIKNKWGRVKIG